MRALLLPLVALAATSTAEAQCHYLPPGYVQINHRNGVLYGGAVNARVSCTWNAPTVLYWRGGPLCRNRYFYGRNALRQPFSCKVLTAWRR